MKNYKHIVFAAGILAVMLVVYGADRAFAQAAPQMRITWRALSLTPADFSGRILASSESQILASVIVIQNGKQKDLSGQVIYWYLNDQLVDSGKGKVTAKFFAPDFAGNPISLRAEIPQSGATLAKEIDIPMSFPQVVIEAPYPDNHIAGDKVVLRASPYYFSSFSTSRLSYSWSVNGSAPQNMENPQTLSISLSKAAPGYALDITLDAKNPLKDEQTAQSSISLSVPK